MSGTLGGRVPVASRTAPIARRKLPPVNPNTIPCPDGEWTALTAGTAGVQAMCAGGVGLGKIYAIGDTFLDSYDITSDTWTTGLDTPPFTIDDRGGLWYQSSGGNEVWAFFTDNAGTATTYAYDKDGDAWSSASSPMPTPRQGFGLATANSRVRLVGGNTPPTFTATTEHEFYNPDDDTWDTAAPLPVAIDFPALFTWSGGMYVFGDTPAVAYFWDSGDDDWTEVRPPPWESSGGYIFGGFPFGGGGLLVGNETDGATWIYDPDADFYFPVPNVGLSLAEAFVAGPSAAVSQGVYVSDFGTGDLSLFLC